MIQKNPTLSFMYNGNIKLVGLLIQVHNFLQNNYLLRIFLSDLLNIEHHDYQIILKNILKK